MRAYPAGHPATLLILSVWSDALAGWTRRPVPAAWPLLPPGLDGLPLLPRLGPDGDPAALRASGAGLVVDVGGLPGAGPDPLADLARAAGLDLLRLDGRLAGLPASIRALADALGQRREDLAGWAAAVLADTAGAAPLTVHYGCGPLGLETPARGSPALEIFHHVGARTLAPDGPGALPAVTPGALAAFDPDAVVLLDPAALAVVRRDPGWACLRAVRAGRVLVGPVLPFPWLDRPPGINRLAGLAWLAAVLNGRPPPGPDPALRLFRPGPT